ncbi:MAG: hypothetical protein WA125_17055 [Desulfosporosinus sp.]
MGVIRNILVRVGANINPLQQGMTQAQRAVGQFSTRSRASMAAVNNGTSGMMAAMATAAKVVTVAAAAIGAAVTMAAIPASKMAMEYESSLQQINRIMGASAAGFVNWAETQANAFNMSRLEAVKYGAVYGNLMSTITADQAQATQYTTQLLKASAVVASATGRNMTDVMERIRSGLLGNTESIEDLGINVNVALLESTETFKRFANGKSWDQLDFRTQQQIRLFGILEQATTKFGDSVYDNTASGLMQFTALLKDAQLNLGQAFLPLINAVMPTLINFANGLKYVTAVFSQFMQALFGVKTKQVDVTGTAAKAASAQTGLGKATKAAGAAAKGALAGFDEINELQEAMAASGTDAADAAINGGGMVVPDASGGGTSPVPDTLIPQSVIDNVERFKKAIEPIQKYISELAAMFRNFWNDIQPFMKPIVDFLEKVFAPIWKWLVEIVGIALEGMKIQIGGALQIIKGILEIFAGLITGNWKMLWQGIKDITWGAWVMLQATFTGLFKAIGDGWNAFVSALREGWETSWKAIGNFALSAWNGIQATAATAWNGIKQVASDAWEGIQQVWSGVAGWFGTNVATPIGNLFAELWSDIKNLFKEGANGAIGSLESFLNFAISGFNKLIFAWNTTKSVLGISGWTMPIEKIQLPRLANGGIVGANRPMLAQIGDNKTQPEVIAPLGDLTEMITSAVSTAMLSVMQFSNSSSSGQQGDIIVQIDSTKLARVIMPAINKEQSRIGNTAIIQAT